MTTLRDLARAVREVPPSALARAIARAPLELHAARLLDALPTVELVDVTGPVTFESRLAGHRSRHDWSLGAAEQMILKAIISGRGVRNVFEIGTFNGGTTRILAEALPTGGQVVTMDLPPDDFAGSQRPRDFTGAAVGQVYRDSPSAGKVTQLLANSLTFDPSPYASHYELVLVDGGHEYIHGVADTRTALHLVAPGGVIVWDDFASYWHGLVRGICEEMAGRRLARLAGTSLGIYVNDG